MKNSDREVEEIVKVYGRVVLKKQLEQTHQKMLKERRWKTVIITLGLVIAIVILVLMNSAKEESSDKLPIAEAQALFGDYFEPYPIPQLRSGDSTTLAQWNQVVSLYQSGLYEQSVDQLESLAEQNSPLQLCLSSAYLAMENDRAADSLLAVLSGTNIYRIDAIWYQALLHLKQGNITAAKQQLTLIENNPSYQERVSRLLAVLE